MQGEVASSSLDGEERDEGDKGPIQCKQLNDMFLLT